MNMDMSGMDMSGMDMATSTTEMNMDTATSTAMHMATTAMTMVMSTSMPMDTSMPMSMHHMSMDMSGTMSMSSMGEMSTMSMGGMSGMNGTSGMGMGNSTMGGMTHMKMKCTMSMLWNWYSHDVCFISDQWKTSTNAIFGGTCVGVFALLLALNWWRRILYQYRLHCTEVREIEVDSVQNAGVALEKQSGMFTGAEFKFGVNMFSDLMIPFLHTCKHEWFWALNKNLAIQRGDKVYIYPSVFEHLLYCIGDTMEWSVHHVVMLLFMYFNGYVFISCMIGAGVGFMLFQLKNLNLTKRGDNVSKRCCL